MYIGIDAGGTKTDICVCRKDGAVIARDISGGVNAARMGAENAAEHFAARLSLLGIASAERLYAGIAGAMTLAGEVKAALERKMPHIKQITVASDAFNALNGEVGMGDGIALIAGTGSAAFVRTGGCVRQVGGRGFLIDDAGSGYWAGRECLNAAYRALDGRGAETVLTAAVEKKIGRPLGDAIAAIYEGGSAYVASFAPLVFEHAVKGDRIALEIAGRCADELILHLKACAEGNVMVCVASGGMFRAEYLKKRLCEAAGEMGIEIIFPDAPPVCGAVMAAAGADADDAFIKILKNGLRG